MDSEVEICVIGMGYIGLPTSLVLAASGKRVHGVDVNPAVVDSLQAGTPTFIEPGIADLLHEVIDNNQLTVSTTPKTAEVFLIAVPTPIRPDKSPDTSYIKAAARAIAPYIHNECLVILESTSPVGTTEMMAKTIEKVRPDLDPKKLGFAHCPERVIPGQMLKEITTNDRIVGGLKAADAEKAAKLYQSFCVGNIHCTDARTAEMAKLAENAFRDVNIAFANELSIIASNAGIDVWELIQLANKHPRVNILQPGPGVGGHCIAVDPWFLISSAPENAALIRTAREVNDLKPQFVINEIESAVDSSQSVQLAIFGLTFKANVDDLRGSPALDIVREIALKYPAWRIILVDPFVKELPSVLTGYANVILSGAEDALNQAPVIVRLVDHQAFDKISTDELADKVVVDTRGQWQGRKL